MSGQSARLRQPDQAVPWTVEQLQALHTAFSERTPQALLRWGVETFGTEMVLGTGFGASGVVLMHMVAQIQPDLTIFYLDTDLLFPETYALRDQLAEKLGIQFTLVPATLPLEEQAATFGQELWRSNPDACCYLRKVIPLRHFLSDKAAWVTGIRRDQSPSRRQVPLVEWSGRNGVLKLNPLALWSEEQVWDYIATYELPSNPLHEQGYVSIGCMPCTHPVQEGEPSRAGRWSGQDKVECGIHIENGRVYRRSALPLQTRSA